MMNFGLGAFLEKFEEYFGKRAERVLIGTVAAALMVMSIGVVATGAQNLVNFASNVTSKNDWVGTAWQIFLNAFSLSATIWVLVMGFRVWRASSVLRRIDGDVKRAEGAVDKAEKLYEEARRAQEAAAAAMRSAQENADLERRK